MDVSFSFFYLFRCYSNRLSRFFVTCVLPEIFCKGPADCGNSTKLQQHDLIAGTVASISWQRKVLGRYHRSRKILFTIRRWFVHHWRCQWTICTYDQLHNRAAAAAPDSLSNEFFLRFFIVRPTHTTRFILINVSMRLENCRRNCCYQCYRYYDIHIVVRSLCK